MARLRLIHQVENFGYMWIDCVEHCDDAGGSSRYPSWYKWVPHFVHASDWSGFDGVSIPINPEVWPLVFVTKNTAPSEVLAQLQLVPDCTTKTAQSRAVAPDVSEVWIQNVLPRSTLYDIWYVRQCGYGIVHTDWIFVGSSTDVFQGAIPVQGESAQSILSLCDEDTTLTECKPQIASRTVGEVH
jgi:hypothetical protein